MKTRPYLMLCAFVFTLYLTSCRVIHNPLHYNTNLQDKVKSQHEKQVGWFGSDLAVVNQVSEEPAITVYSAAPDEPFEFSVIADYVVHELEGLELLFVDPIPMPVTLADHLKLSKLIINVDKQPLIEISDFGSDFNEEEAFTQTLPNLKAPSIAGETDHYEFIGYWIDMKKRTLAQGIWVDVTAKASDNAKSNKNPLTGENARFADIVKLQGGLMLATKGGKDDYSYGDQTKHPLKPGLTLGATLPYRFSNQLSIEAGLQIESKGFREKYTYEGDYYPDQGYTAATTAMLANDSFRKKTSLTYLGIPVVAHLLPVPKLPGLGFAIGLQPSLLLSRKTKTNAFGNTNTEKGTAGFKSWDAGLLLGARYQLTDELGLALSYEHGLVDITENNFDTFKNRSIKLMATYALPFHLKK